MRVNVHEDDFDDRLVGLVLRDQFAQAGIDGLQALRQRGFGVGLDAAAGDIGKVVAGLFDQAETGDAQTGVDAEDARCPGAHFCP